MNQNKFAQNICLNSLRYCYETYGIIAGRHHFTDYWARDGYFAALGALAIGDKYIVNKMVDLFFSHQRPDGLIPYRIMRGPINLNKYLGRPTFFKKPKPTFKLRGVGNEVLDGTTLTVLFANLTNNYDKYHKNVDLAIKYLANREKNGLLWDGFMAEWNDTTLKFGNLLYSNIIYWYMFARLAINNNQYQKKANIIASNLRKILWNGKYFSDWYDYKRHDYFYPFGNCLAIAWGLTTPKESKSILAECEKIKINFTLETNFPKYPFWRIDPLQQLIGMGGYQNQNLLWWQPVCAYIAALKEAGQTQKALVLLETVSKKIIKDKQIYECYSRNNQPFHRLHYTAEHPFAWASGMLTWVYEKINLTNKKI